MVQMFLQEAELLVTFFILAPYQRSWLETWETLSILACFGGQCSSFCLFPYRDSLILLHKKARKLPFIVQLLPN